MKSSFVIIGTILRVSRDTIKIGISEYPRVAVVIEQDRHPYQKRPDTFKIDYIGQYADQVPEADDKTQRRIVYKGARAVAMGHLAGTVKQSQDGEDINIMGLRGERLMSITRGEIDYSTGTGKELDNALGNQTT